MQDLFLSTPSPKLSSIYMTLGCSHSLQPTPNDDFVPPSIPALTSRGFVIWQTIQLLLDPEEHVPYLQEAARIFPLINPENNQPFPREIPKEAFPAGPDKETVKWHDEMFAKQSAKEAAADKKDASKHGKVQVPVPGEHVDAGGYTEYHRHHHHHPQYAEQQYASRSRRNRRHAAAPAPAPEPPVEDERYSRSAPGADPFAHSHPRHHSQHPPEPIFTSDSEGMHRHSRHHSRRGTREREFSKPYVYENGVVTPVVSVFPAVIDLGDGVHIISDQIPSSPPLPSNSHFRHSHPNYQAPTVTGPGDLSCSSSYSDLNGAYHSHHHSPQHISHTHVHREHSLPRSSSPIRHAEPPLRKSQSAYYYAQDPAAHTHVQSRSRSGGSGRRIRQNISDMDSDVSDANIQSSTWAIQSDRFRAEEEAAERENIRRRGQSKDDTDRRHRRSANPERERTENWDYSGGGGGGGGGGGRSGGSKRYYRGFYPGPMEGLRGAYFY